jgi:mono/diheme cytochrome c family protein
MIGAGCVAGVVPEAPADDPELVQGRDVYIANCVSCHGGAGAGGRGNKLNEGQVLESFPDPADQVALVTGGRQAMPAFGDRLSNEEIEAVVRFTREVLAS